MQLQAFLIDDAKCNPKSDFIKIKKKLAVISMSEEWD